MRTHCPTRRWNQCLFRRIVWHLQAKIEGGLSERARLRAAQIADDADLRLGGPKGHWSWPGERRAHANPSSSRQRDVRLPEPGTVLKRRYQGREIVVKVLENSFEYESTVSFAQCHRSRGEARAGFRSLTEAIDTTTPAGRMMMQMVGAFAEFERAMLRERTKAGLDAARQEGRIGGRRPKLSARQQSEIRKMVSKGDKTGADAARLFKVHPATVSRLMARAEASEPMRRALRAK